MIRILVLLLLAPAFGYADEASHRKSASALLAELGGAKLFLAGTEAMLGPVEGAWRQQGIDEAVIAIMKRVLNEWCAEDLDWSELEPGIVDVYVRHFSESDLQELLAFYRTPVGKKAIQTLPVVMSEAAAVGAKFAEAKQPLLEARLARAMADAKAAMEKARSDATEQTDDVQGARKG